MESLFRMSNILEYPLLLGLMWADLMAETRAVKKVGDLDAMKVEKMGIWLVVKKAGDLVVMMVGMLGVLMAVKKVD